MKLLIQFLILFILFIFIPVSGYTQHWQWAIEGSGTKGASYALKESVQSYESVTDANGNTYVTGYFLGVARFGSFLLSGNDKLNLFIAKYDASGNVLWVKKSDAVHTCVGTSLVLGGDGNLYVAGYFQKSVTIGVFTLTDNSNSNDTHTFILKMNTASGSVEWVATTTGTGKTIPNAIAVDADENVFVAGTFDNTVSFGTDSFESANGQHTYLAKYDRSGKVVRASAFETGGEDWPRIGVDGAGNCYLAGNYTGKAIFGSHTLISNTWSFETYFVKLDASLQLLWAKRSETVGLSRSADMVTDVAGYSYIVGSFVESKQFGGNLLKANGRSALFLAKYNPEGEVEWAVQKSGQGNVVGHSIATDNAGNIYMSGLFDASVTFGAYTLNAMRTDMFIAKLRPTGEAVWALATESDFLYEQGSSIDVDKDGNCYVSGNFFNSITFGSSTLVGIRPHHIATFLAKTGKAPIEESSIQNVTVNSNQVCGGEKVPVHFEHKGPFNDGNLFIVQISDSKGSFDWPIVIGSGTESPVMAVIPLFPGVGTGYRIRVISASPFVNGGDTGTGIRITEKPLRPFISPHFLCGIAVTGGHATLIASGAVAGQSYRWYNSATDTTPIPGESSASFTTPFISEDTTFYVSILGENGCESDRVAVPIEVDLLPLVDQGLDERICIDRPAAPLSHFTPAEGVWSGKGVSASGIFDPAVAGLGKHELTFVFFQRLCTITATKTVEVVDAPLLVNATLINRCGTDPYTKYYTPFKATFTSESKNASVYTWDFGDGKTSTQKDPTHLYDKPGRYDVYLTVSNENGCSQRQLVTSIEVEEGRGIPNVITPNGDNLNDKFELYLTCLPVQLGVFNRWGKLVFEQKNYKNNWDGGNQPAGIYYYLLKTDDGLSWKGWVEIIR